MTLPSYMSHAQNGAPRQVSHVLLAFVNCARDDGRAMKYACRNRGELKDTLRAVQRLLAGKAPYRGVPVMGATFDVTADGARLIFASGGKIEFYLARRRMG